MLFLYVERDPSVRHDTVTHVIPLLTHTYVCLRLPTAKLLQCSVKCDFVFQ